MKTLGIVQVHPRAGDTGAMTRLRQLARRRLGPETLLHWVVRRTTEAEKLDRTIVVLSDRPEDKELAPLVPGDVSVFVGSQTDPISRVTAAASEFDADAIVSVEVDGPFVDPMLIDRLVLAAEEASAVDYVGFCSRDGKRALQSTLGLFAQWCRLSSLLKASEPVLPESDRHDVGHCLYSRPDLFQLKLLPAPKQLDRKDLRLVVAGEEDWDHAQSIIEALGPDRLDWQHIAGLIEHQPALRKRMAVLNEVDCHV